jgi:NRAMP (natural resistance-associated macrophage protein)-like metal ion transporter
MRKRLRRKQPASGAAQPEAEVKLVDPILSLTRSGTVLVDPPAVQLYKGRSGAPTVNEAPGPSGPGSRSRVAVGYLRALGPGLITGASDDDPSGIGTYSQVGSQFGFGFLWTAAFTLPMMSAVQELCARIALQTGVGLGVALRRKFSAWIVGPAILALAIANTVNLGADLGAVAAGGSLLSRGAIPALWLVLPVAVLVIGLQFFTTYTVIFRAFKYLTLVLLAYVITAVVVHPRWSSVLTATFVPRIDLSADSLTALVAILGTTISPYLFFWQASAEVDDMKAQGKIAESKRRTTNPQEIRRARFDIFVGMFLSQVVMYCIILTSASALHGHGKTDVQTAQQAAEALAPLAGQFASVLFAIGLIGTGLLAVPILSGSASYAVKEFVGFKGWLAVSPRYQPTFYAVILLATALGVLMNFLDFSPIRALFISAVINGVIAAPLLLLIVLVGRDKGVMRRWVSGKLSVGLTGLTTAVMGAAAVAMIALALLHH